MGYYTDFELQYDSSRSDPFELDRFKADSRKGKKFGSYDLDLDDSSWGSMKWYEHDQDMKALSEEYPNVMFVLTGRGEDGESWRSWYMNGVVKTSNATVTYDEPNYTQFPQVDLRGKRKAEAAARKKELERELARVQAELDTLV